jgi:hypothetical protein
MISREKSAGVILWGEVFSLGLERSKACVSLGLFAFFGGFM